MEIRSLIRKIIKEEFETIKVVKAYKVGLDHLNYIKIILSNGKEDSVREKDATIISSSAANYNIMNTASGQNNSSCLTTYGIVPGGNPDLRYKYSFYGITCGTYNYIDPKTIALANDQIS